MSESQLEGERRDGRLSAGVAVVIALATLIAAGVGYLQAESANAANDRRLEAEQLSLAALASAQREQQLAQVEYATFARSVEQRTAAGNALLRSLYAEEGSPEAVAHQREHERWQRLAEATARLSDIDPEGPLGPRADPTFPARYFAQAAFESLRLNALQDAANEEALLLDERAASYTAVLAMLAVSLYLLGLTLAVSERPLQLGFLGVGVLLLSLAAGWTLLIAAQPAARADPGAATAYARGRVAAETAFDPAGYRQAAAHFDTAIELRPSFARAYAERSSATFLAATPQRTGFASIVPVEALRSARSDLETALELGLRTPSIFGSLGFYAFVEGVQAGDNELLEQSVEFTERAIALDRQEPVYRFNLAVVLLAAGQQEQALSAYDDAVATALYTDPARTALRGEPFIEEAWLAGALTDLEIVAAHRPELAGEVARAKERIVGPISAATLEPLPAADVSLSELALDVFPGEVQWQAALNDYDAARDVVSAQWYHRAPGGLGWAVIPEISRPATPSLGNDGRFFSLASYITAVVPPACLSAGAYRAEIYINGRLLGVGEVEPGFGQLEAFVARDLTVAFCRPADWQRLEERLPGLIDGYLSDDGQQGAYALHYALPRRFADLEGVSAEIIGVTLDAFADDFPAPPTYMEEEGTSAEYFMGLDATAWRWYDYGSGYVRAAAGLSAEGAVIVAFVFGPYDWFGGEEPYRILDSFVRYQ